MDHQLGIERIDHVAVIVTDVARAVRFYQEVLGLSEVPRPASFDFPGAWVAAGTTCIHLLGKPSRDADSARHFCLWVRDLRTIAAHLESTGRPVQWNRRHKIPGVDRFFLHDPDGNRIEIQGPELTPPP